MRRRITNLGSDGAGLSQKLKISKISRDIILIYWGDSFWWCVEQCVTVRNWIRGGRVEFCFGYEGFDWGVHLEACGVGCRWLAKWWDEVNPWWVYIKTLKRHAVFGFAFWTGRWGFNGEDLVGPLLSLRSDLHFLFLFFKFYYFTLLCFMFYLSPQKIILQKFFYLTNIFYTKIIFRFCVSSW